MDNNGYINKRTELISKLFDYKNILSEEEKNIINNSDFNFDLIDNNDVWKYKLTLKNDMSKSNIQSSKVIRSKSVIGNEDSKVSENKKLSKKEYINKLAEKNKFVDNSKNTLDLYNLVKEIKCTCKKKGCTPLKPGPGCARTKALYATEAERNECSFKPVITRYKDTKERKEGTFVERIDNDIRALRKVC